MKLEVPYYSQYLDINDSFWMLRACGAVSLAMVVEFYGKESPNLLSLCNEAKDRGGYDMVNGWVHEYIITKAYELGLNAYRKEGLETTELLEASLKEGKPVIVSVEKRVLEQTRFHMVVLVGFDEETQEFTYHEPESTDKIRGAYRSCSKKVFMEYWRGKALFISQ